MADVEDDHRSLGLVDLVEDAPLVPWAGAVDAGERVLKRVADPARLLEQRPGDELEGSRRARVRWRVGVVN